jgi:hypothetical protein
MISCVCVGALALRLFNVASGIYLQFFSSLFCNIIMAKGLRALGIKDSGQNLEAQGLTGKIFWNKELASIRTPRGMGFVSGDRVRRTFAHPSSLRVPEFSVKVVRHRSGENFCGRLWKRLAVSKGLS